ncbi:hypothetical protein ANO11243_003760 [Dothideomycetidae sp. 11243]|nr:hypothetical protein ANO11243_003760 [fungal sp. No.11243]
MTRGRSEQARKSDRRIAGGIREKETKTCAMIAQGWRRMSRGSASLPVPPPHQQHVRRVIELSPGRRSGFARAETQKGLNACYPIVVEHGIFPLSAAASNVSHPARFVPRAGIVRRACHSHSKSRRSSSSRRVPVSFTPRSETVIENVLWENKLVQKHAEDVE